MESMDYINSTIEEKIAAFEAAELAKIQKRIERKKVALREKYEKEIELRLQAEKARAEALEKLSELPQQLGYGSVAELVRALGELLSPKERSKIFEESKKKQLCLKNRRGPGNGLSSEERAEIAKLRGENVSTAEIAKRFRISVNTVYSIKRAK